MVEARSVRDRAPGVSLSCCTGGRAPLTRFYDHLLAPSGLRTTQFAILASLHRLGPMTIDQSRGCVGFRPHHVGPEYPASAA